MIHGKSSRALGTLLTLGIIGGIAVGCSSSPAEPEKTPTAEAAPKPDPTPTPTRTPVIIEWKDFPPFEESVTSERGGTVKQVGQSAGISTADDVLLMRFMVLGITLDPECEGGEEAPKPESGHFVRVDIQGEATPELAQAYEEGGVLPALTFSEWTALDGNGVTANGPAVTEASIACLTPAESVYYADVQPGNKAVGSVVLDVPNETGIIVFHWGPDNTWEYSY